MYLQDHFGLYSFGLEPLIDTCHCYFYNICRTSLDRGVDGISFRISAYNGIPGIDVRQKALPMENCFYITFFLGHLNTFVHIGFHSRISFKVTVDQFFGFFAVYIHPFGKTKYGYAIDDTEIGSLGFTAHVGTYVFQVDLINFGSSGRMNIVIAKESINHILILAKVCHDAQFDLRIVGREEEAAFIGDESLADFFSILVADRDIL